MLGHFFFWIMSNKINIFYAPGRLYSPLRRTQFAVCPRPKLSIPFSDNANELISYWCCFFFSIRNFDFLAAATAEAAAVAARKLLLNWRLIISKPEISVARAAKRALVVVAVVVRAATWLDYCRFCCCCCCCCNTKLGVELHFHFCLLLLLLLLFCFVLVAVACRVLFPFFLLCCSFPKCCCHCHCCCLFVSGRAVAAASLALISGFRERGCRGLQVYVRVRMPCMCVCALSSKCAWLFWFTFCLVSLIYTVYLHVVLIAVHFNVYFLSILTSFAHTIYIIYDF